MKLKVFSYSVTALLLLFIGYGCSDNSLTDREIQDLINNSLDGQWKKAEIEIKKSNWNWNPNTGRYEAIADLPELTEFIYENGAILGYVFIGEQNKDEVQKTLPFVHTYVVKDTSGNITDKYTETISFDVQYAPNGKSTVAFFIQNSNFLPTDNYLADYNFRIILIS